MSSNTEPTAVPIAVHMIAISAMNKNATGSSSGCAGRNPAARQTRKTMLPWISATVAAPSVRPSTHRRHQGFLQEAELAVPDNLDAAEDGGEQDAHRDNARRQELHVVAAAGAGEGGPEPEPERQQEQGWLAERADHTGARAEIALQLSQPQDEDGVHRRPSHTRRIMRMRSIGAASASRMLCPVSAMNASSSVLPPVCSRSAAAVPSATIRPWSMTAISSATRSASSMKCVVKNTVTCSSRLRRG